MTQYTWRNTYSSNSRHSPIAGVPDQLCCRPWAWGTHPDPSPEGSVGGTCTSHQSLLCQWQQTQGGNLHLSACTAPALRWTPPARLCPELTEQQHNTQMLTHVCVCVCVQTTAIHIMRHKLMGAYVRRHHGKAHSYCGPLADSTVQCGRQVPTFLENTLGRWRQLVPEMFILTYQTADSNMSQYHE